MQAALKAAGREGEKTIDRIVSERLRAANDDRATLEAFRETLSELAAAMANQTNGAESHPLVFIVDELDRFRPPFALSIIERIKHLFSVPGVCFLLVTHIPQLATAIQGAYGAQFDGETYLEKFYQLQIKLPEIRDQEGRQQSRYVQYLWQILELNFGNRDRDDDILSDLKGMAEAYRLPLRRIERIMSDVAIVSAAAGPRRMVLSPIVVGLCVMRHLRPDLYEFARKDQLTWLHVTEFLEPAKQDEMSEWSINWWKRVLGEELTTEERTYRDAYLRPYRIDNPRSAILFSAKLIDDLIQDSE